MKPVPQPKRSSFEMLPLMDMIFLLLVVFIFMIVQMRPNFGISIELPDVGVKQPETPKQKTTVTISVSSDNSLFVNSTKCQFDQLHSVIVSQSKNVPVEDLSVILSGDKGADYGEIMKVFSILRENNISDILFDVNSVKS